MENLGRTLILIIKNYFVKATKSSMKNICINLPFEINEILYTIIFSRE